MESEIKVLYFEVVNVFLPCLIPIAGIRII
jgi:hypothetical protein